MLLHRPLMAVTPTIDGDVLTVLARADATFTAPKVQRLLERHSVPGVRKVLNRLVEQGIVNADQAGRTLTYRLNRDHLAAAPIIELAHLDDALIERIRTAVATWDQAPLLVMLFGSAATGRMRIDSDIDVFVVRERTKRRQRPLASTDLRPRARHHEVDGQRRTSARLHRRRLGTRQRRRRRRHRSRRTTYRRRPNLAPPLAPAGWLMAPPPDAPRSAPQRFELDAWPRRSSSSKRPRPSRHSPTTQTMSPTRT